MCPSSTRSLRCFFSYCDAWSFHLGPPGKLKRTDIFHFYIIGSFQDSDSLFRFRRSALNYIVSWVKDWDSIGATFLRGLQEGSANCSLHLPIHAFYFLSSLTYMLVPIKVSWFVNLFFFSFPLAGSFWILRQDKCFIVVAFFTQLRLVFIF